MLPFGVTIPATVPQRSEIPEGLMNYPVYGGEQKCIEVFERNLKKRDHLESPGVHETIILKCILKK
jgi:hypothetical protein